MRRLGFRGGGRSGGGGRVFRWWEVVEVARGCRWVERYAMIIGINIRDGGSGLMMDDS